jgi:hypothetical protein
MHLMFLLLVFIVAGILLRDKYPRFLFMVIAGALIGPAAGIGLLYIAVEIGGARHSEPPVAIASVPSRTCSDEEMASAKAGHLQIPPWICRY